LAVEGRRAFWAMLSMLRHGSFEIDTFVGYIILYQILGFHDRPKADVPYGTMYLKVFKPQQSSM
jgi:hypothetical protein